MSIFGVVGLFLASVGTFGLIKYLVERRTRELGLRIAPRRGTASAVFGVNYFCRSTTIILAGVR